MTEKRQTAHGYIIRILQHFATKLWNITNFVMLFQAVMKFFLDQNLVYNANGPLYESFS
jgi:valyl-tRNA synthetase